MLKFYSKLISRATEYTRNDSVDYQGAKSRLINIPQSVVNKIINVISKNTGQQPEQISREALLGLAAEDYSSLLSALEKDFGIALPYIMLFGRSTTVENVIQMVWESIAPKPVTAEKTSKSRSERSSSFPKDISEKVYLVLSDKLEVDLDKINPEASLQYDLGADSLDRYELCYALEEVFGITLDDDTLEINQTVADIILIVTNKLSLKQK